MGLIPMDSNCAIATHDLRKVYGAKAAVDGLNLEVPRGLLLRLSRTQWRRQDHHHSYADGFGAAHLRDYRIIGPADARLGFGSKRPDRTGPR